jgi:hypothetical protein
LELPRAGPIGEGLDTKVWTLSLWGENMATKKNRSSAKRELIDTGRDKRYVKRDDQGQFKESDDVGKSLAADVRRKAETKVKAGYGDQGDQPKRAAKKSAKKTVKKR